MIVSGVDLDAWCRLVLEESNNFDKLGDKWAPPWHNRSAPIAPLESAIARDCTIDDAIKIGQTMRNYDGPGRIDFELLGGVLLKTLPFYRASSEKSKQRRYGPVRDEKMSKSPREISAIVRIARLLADRSQREKLTTLLAGVAPTVHQKDIARMSKTALGNEIQRKDMELSETIDTYEATIAGLEAAHEQQVASLRRLLKRHTDAKSKALKRLGTSRGHFKQRLAAKRDELAEKAVAEAEASFGAVVERLRQLKNDMAARKRAAEAEAAKSTRRAERASAACKRAEEKLAELRDLEGDAFRCAETIASFPAAMRTFGTVGKGKGNGRGRVWPWWLRAMIAEQLIHGTPPSAVLQNIVSDVHYVAPWIKVALPNLRFVQRMRQEVRIVAETLAAARVAWASSVRQLGADGTERKQISLLTSNLLIEEADGSLKPVILASAYITPGKTAEIEGDSIATRCFARGRTKLRRWRQQHEKMFPGQSHSIPEAEKFALRRLGGGGALSNDTCNQALALRRVLVDKIAKEVKEDVGSEAWAAMSPAEKARRVRTHEIDCWNHQRCVWLGAGASAATAFLKLKLEESLAQFSSFSRISPDVSNLVRAVYKEFHLEGEYSKGKGNKEFGEWMRRKYPKVFWLSCERADGARQDLDFEGCVAIFVNRKYYVEFLKELMLDPEHSNVLEDYLIAILMCLEMIAWTRAASLIHLGISKGMRFFAGKAHQLQEWSPYKLAEIADVIDDALEAISADGAVMLDIDYNLYSDYLDKQPLYRAHCDYLKSKKARSPDKSLEHPCYNLTLSELVEPQDASNKRATDITIELLQVIAEAMQNKMRDKHYVTNTYLTSTDGAKAIAKITPEMHADTGGCTATNDILAESVLGQFTEYFNKYGTISVASASGMATARGNGDLARKDHAAEKRKGKAAPAVDAPVGIHRLADRRESDGVFHGMSAEMKQSLFEFGRIYFDEQDALDKQDRAEHDDYWQRKRKANREAALEKLTELYIDAVSYFEMKDERATTATSVTFYLLRPSILFDPQGRASK